MSDFKHQTPICPHCGAAYTPHTSECPRYGYPPPALAPKGPVGIDMPRPFGMVVDPPVRIEQRFEITDADPDRICRATAKALDGVFKGKRP